MSEKLRRWLIAGVMVLGIIPFVWTSIVPLLGSVETGQTSAQETATPTPTSTTQPVQVSQEARQEELKQRLLGQVRGYEAILQTEPENQTALLALFETRKELVQLGAADIKQTIEPLETLIRLNPNDIVFQLELGSIYAQQQRLDDAIAIYDKATKIDPQDYRPLLAKGIVLQLQGKKEEAKPLFNRATEIAPAAFKQQVQAQIQQIEILTSAPKASPTPGQPVAPTPATVPKSDTQTQPVAPAAAPKSDPQTQPVAPAPATTPENNLTNPNNGDIINPPEATPSP
ncbi:tetratricopeptide repeat protein [Microseira wollei]|uniref:Tetratricopeptide TPR_2 n=1 Tax=Microseira wollei NIES-4236 TaxID=2530354 RepID=A0AAV3WJH3_9CYAN|nr:tetratricopeptide repeat protein [Microseira wollei]GET40239.1 tetratricopeptide TPR_2 [Microseira wollei NIES-4236]